MDEKFNRLEEMIGTLIQMVGNVSARVEEIAQDLKETKQDLKETKDIIHTFRSETDVNFKKLDRCIKLIETDLDETMVKVAEITLPKQ